MAANLCVGHFVDPSQKTLISLAAFSLIVGMMSNSESFGGPINLIENISAVSTGMPCALAMDVVCGCLSCCPSLS